MVVYGKYECFVMQMLYVCVLCASCGSSQFCMTYSLLMLVEDARGDHVEEAYSSASLMNVSVSSLPHPLYYTKNTMVLFLDIKPGIYIYFFLNIHIYLTRSPVCVYMFIILACLHVNVMNNFFNDRTVSILF